MLRGMEKSAASPLLTSTLSTMSVSVRRLQRPGPASPPTSSTSSRPSVNGPGRGVGEGVGVGSVVGASGLAGEQGRRRAGHIGRIGDVAEAVVPLDVAAVGRREDRLERVMDGHHLRADDVVRGPGDGQQGDDRDRRQDRVRDLRAAAPPGVEDGRRAPDEEQDVEDGDAHQDVRLDEEAEQLGVIAVGDDDADEDGEQERGQEEEADPDAALEQLAGAGDEERKERSERARAAQRRAGLARVGVLVPSGGGRVGRRACCGSPVSSRRWT